MLNNLTLNVQYKQLLHLCIINITSGLNIFGQTTLEVKYGGHILLCAVLYCVPGIDRSEAVVIYIYELSD